MDVRTCLRIVAGAFVFCCWPSLHAMNRWDALSQIESGNKDFAVGSAGEISRYQIKPALWRRYAPSTADWHNAAHSLLAAQRLMKERSEHFQRVFSRAPTDLEFYILWNAPGQIQKPGKAVRERAARFRNLVGTS
jgi:hypothetical protein